jgi:hypothetical protein
MRFPSQRSIKRRCKRSAVPDRSSSFAGSSCPLTDGSQYLAPASDLVDFAQQIGRIVVDAERAGLS